MTAVKVEGGARLRRTLKRAGVDLADLKAAHIAVAETVITAQKPTVPRRTGLLSATVRSAKQQNQAIVYAGKAAVPYANAVHWGNKKANIKSNPWLWEAARRSEPQWLAEYEREIIRIIGSVKGM
jgi:hypothetical protein